MIFDPYGKAGTKPNKQSGAINITVEDNVDYSFTSVTSLTMAAANVECHGFVTFGASAPTIAVSGFDGSSGDDITAAAAAEVWEFSVYAHSSKSYIIWKNWSA